MFIFYIYGSSLFNSEGNDGGSKGHSCTAPKNRVTCFGDRFRVQNFRVIIQVLEAPQKIDMSSRQRATMASDVLPCAAFQLQPSKRLGKLQQDEPQDPANKYKFCQQVD